MPIKRRLQAELLEPRLPLAPVPAAVPMAGDAQGAVATAGDDPQNLVVDSFVPASSGFTAHFTRDLDVAALNLYDSVAAGLGPADVDFRDGSGRIVVGSLVVGDSLRTVTFQKSGGTLEPGTYSVVLRSARDGFRTSDGEPLDGDGDGISTGDYTTTFVVGQPARNTVTIGAPDFVRGPGQAVNLTASTGGIPLSISDGSLVRDIELRIVYDPALLAVTGARLGEAMPVEASVTLDASTPGAALVRLSSPVNLPFGSNTLVRLEADVPASAQQVYPKQGVLDLQLISVRDAANNEVPAVDDDGLHLATYFADVTGNGRVNASDASQVARYAALVDNGFAGIPLTDPFLAGDISQNGRVNAADASWVALLAAGFELPGIPPIPNGLRRSAAGGMPSPEPTSQLTGTAPSLDELASRSLKADAAIGTWDTSSDTSLPTTSRRWSGLLTPAAQPPLIGRAQLDAVLSQWNWLEERQLAD